MTSTDSIKFHDSEHPKKPPPSGKTRIKKWLHWKRDPPLAVVLRNDSKYLAVEESNDVNRETDAFEIQLPRWHNRVHVYADMKNQQGYAATLRLDRLGVKKNWQRRLGLNYNVLHVKGNKLVRPEEF